MVTTERRKKRNYLKYREFEYSSQLKGFFNEEYSIRIDRNVVVTCRLLDLFEIVEDIINDRKKERSN